MKLTSPNYPDLYDPLEHCKWTIAAPHGHFVTLDFEHIDVSNMQNVDTILVKSFNLNA